MTETQFKLVYTKEKGNLSKEYWSVSCNQRKGWVAEPGGGQGSGWLTRMTAASAPTPAENPSFHFSFLLLSLSWPYLLSLQTNLFLIVETMIPDNLWVSNPVGSSFQRELLALFFVVW